MDCYDSANTESRNDKNECFVCYRLMPTPREFSSDCGISVYFECDSKDIITNALDGAKIEYEIKESKNEK